MFEKFVPVLIEHPQQGGKVELPQRLVSAFCYGALLLEAQTVGEHAVGLMVRRERTQLVETIERSRQLFAPLGARFNEHEWMWRFPSGARLRFAYLERDADADPRPIASSSPAASS